MAFVKIKYCRHCEKENQHTNNKCNICCERERREAMAAWQAKTKEEKLLDLHKRLLRLESGPARY
jgi:DUF1680 family protein